MGQVWFAADLDGADPTFSDSSFEGGRGSVIAVTAQNLNLDTPVNSNPAQASVHWTPGNPNDHEFDRIRGFYSLHPTGANFGFADGSTRFFSETIDNQTYRDLSTMRGKEILGEF